MVLKKVHYFHCLKLEKEHFQFVKKPASLMEAGFFVPRIAEELGEVAQALSAAFPSSSEVVSS